MLFETRCAGCDRPGAAVCTTCRFALLGRTPRPQPHGVLAAVPFAGRARDVLLAVKYRNRRQAARHVAGLLVNRLLEAGAHRGVDVVTWAPTSRPRRRERGFDQAEVIARTVARQLGLPCRRLLAPAGDAAGQTGRSRADRLHAPRFVARSTGLAGRSVLVVDDVVTTGATLHAARRALSDAGAGTVRLAAVAATPAAAGVQASARVGAGRRADRAVVVPFRQRGSTTAA